MTQAREMLEPKIKTNHFHGKDMPLSSVLFALAAAEGNDGDEGNAMQLAGETIRALYNTLEAHKEALRVEIERLKNKIKLIRALISDPRGFERRLVQEELDYCIGKITQIETLLNPERNEG